MVTEYAMYTCTHRYIKITSLMDSNIHIFIYTHYINALITFIYSPCISIPLHNINNQSRWMKSDFECM